MTPWNIAAGLSWVLVIASVVAPPRVRRPLVVVALFASAAAVLAWTVSGMSYEDVDAPFPWWWSAIWWQLGVQTLALFGYLVVRIGQRIGPRR